MGVPVGGGTDATRVSSYNPWLALYWLSSGNTVGGMELYDEKSRLSRETSLEIYTKGSAWFSNEQDKKGSIAVGELADLAVLNKDFFSVTDEEIKSLESVFTVVGGKIVYATGDLKKYAPPDIPILPDWSPTHIYNGYYPGSNNRQSL